MSDMSDSEEEDHHAKRGEDEVDPDEEGVDGKGKKKKVIRFSMGARDAMADEEGEEDDEGGEGDKVDDEFAVFTAFGEEAEREMKEREQKEKERKKAIERQRALLVKGASEAEDRKNSKNVNREREGERKDMENSGRNVDDGAGVAPRDEMKAYDGERMIGAKADDVGSMSLILQTGALLL
jgi:hypothetical protein